MPGWETRMQLKHYLAPGVSKAALSRRFGVASGCSAPCVRPETPAGHQRENVRFARDVLPRSVQFSVAIYTKSAELHKERACGA